jgi:hypothetical protein
LTVASRSWPHGTTTSLSLILVDPVGAPVVLVLVVLEVLAAVTVVSVVPVVVSAVEIAVFVVPVLVLVVPMMPVAGVAVVPVVALVAVGLVVVSVISVVLVPVVRSHAPFISPCFRWASCARAPTVIVWPLWQRVTFGWPRPPPSSCSAKATVATDSTVTTTIAATTLRIDTLRLIPILLPHVGGLYLYVWLATLQVRAFFPSLG